MTTENQNPADVALNEELQTLVAELSGWTREQRLSVAIQLGGYAMISGTQDHPDFVRTAKALSRLRFIIRAVERVTKEGTAK